MRLVGLSIAFAVLLGFVSLAVVPVHAYTVTIDQNTEYQTIAGWGNAGGIPGVAGILTNGKTITSDELRSQLIVENFENLGLTSTYIWTGNSFYNWETYNDNTDANSFNINARDTRDVDRDARLALDVKQLVESRGDKFLLMARTGYAHTNWLLYSPGEYTEQALSVLSYLKNTYGLTVDYWGVENEPNGPGKFYNPLDMAETIRTVGPAMQANGYPTKLMYPESLSAVAAWNMISPLQSDTQLWPYVGMYTWHLYGTTDPYRGYILSHAQQYGGITGQTEAGQQNLVSLYNDLTQGGVSYWATQFAVPVRPKPTQTSFTRDAEFFNLRQVIHYAPPGSVRIKATSSYSLVRSLAFKKDGRLTTVLISSNTVDSPVDIIGLPPGTYAMSQNIGAGPYTELGLVTVSGTLSVSVPAGGVLTVYPYTGINLPPSVTTWTASPEYLTLPSSSATLRVTATDPELSALTYAWTVKKKPAGANPVFSASNAATTTVSGLSVAGNYTFSVTVSDGSLTTTRDVMLNVYTTNQKPYLFEVITLHQRRYFVGDQIIMKGEGYDIDANPMSYKWSLVSKPQGSSVTLSSTTKSAKTSTIDLPGTYQFKLEVSDVLGSNSDTLTIVVSNFNAIAPTINSASASQLTSNTAQLQASASDPNGEAIIYWWSVVNKPVGASPVISSPSTASTTVTNLISGTYSFKVAAMDERNVTFQTVNLVMSGTGGNTTPPDTTPPVATIVAPTNNQVFPAGTLDVTFTVTTNEVATCKLGLTDQNYASMPVTLSASPGTSHSKTFDITVQQTLTRYVRCMDLAGNAMTTSESVTFTITNTTAPPTPTKTGDLNQDGKVDMTDLNIVIAKLGIVPQGTTEDLNNDGKVNILDIATLTRNWGTS